MPTPDKSLLSRFLRFFMVGDTPSPKPPTPPPPTPKPEVDPEKK